jgi:uncharacterized membrane protein YccC
MKQFFLSSPILKHKVIVLLVGILIAALVSLLTIKFEAIGPLVLVAVCLAVVFTIFVFKNPRNGLITLIFYCFMMFFLGRELPGIPYGIGIEVILILTLFCCSFFLCKKGLGKLSE